MMSRAIVWYFIVAIFVLLIACQSQKKTSQSLDTPENTVRALSAVCSERDIEGVLALYEATARQQQSSRISEMQQEAVIAGISQKDQDEVALAMICIPFIDTEPDHIGTVSNNGNATVLYVYEENSSNSVIFQIDLVQQEATWMITNVEFKLPSEN